MKKAILLIVSGFLALHAFSQQKNKQHNLISEQQRKEIMRSLKEIQISINKIDTLVQVQNDTIKNKSKIIAQTDHIKKQLSDINLIHIGDYTDTLLFVYGTFSKRFINYTRIGLKAHYEPQISAFQDYIDLYREKTQTLYQHFRSLEPDMDIINMIKVVKIKTDSIKKTVAKLSTKAEVDTLADSLSGLVKSTNKLKIKSDTIFNRTKTIDSNISLLKAILKPLPAPKGIISITGYDNNVFGISYFFTVSRSTDAIYRSEGDVSQHVGAQFVFPVSSAIAKDPGVFVMYALRDKKLLLQAGMGYFNNGKPQNVSWLCGLLYFPQKFGIGLSWSPIMNTGLQLAFKF